MARLSPACCSVTSANSNCESGEGRDICPLFFCEMRRKRLVELKKYGYNEKNTRRSGVKKVEK